uniref:Vanin-like protein 2 n=1 Tax=Lygus hesperus TaxID=30085 RepID=A0A146LGU5_LYGHE
MATKLSVLLQITACIVYTTAVENAGHYRAAVVDYHILEDYNLSPQENLMANVHNFEQYIKRANEESADIIVFPEGALRGTDNLIFLTVPDPAQKVIPVGNQIYDESIQTLSLYAKNYSIYVAVNLHERYTDPNTTKSFKYNTNVVFNREGAIVARYRKFNLYGEGVNITDNPEHSFFDSDFGVRFGQFICFDILFKEPTLVLINKYNVTDFIFSSHWFSELPFLTSVQRQWSWAVGNDVNLISAGVNNVTSGSSGSGIFRGKNSNNLYTLSTMTGSTLLIGDVPIRGKTGGFGKPDVKVGDYTKEEKYPLLQQNEMSKFAHDDIALPTDRTSVVFKKDLCHNHLCCTFDLSVQYVNPTPAVQYKIVAYDGDIQFGIDPRVNMLQTCGVVLCLNHSVSSCGSAGVNGFLPTLDTPVPNVTFTSINISGNFVKKDANILPNVLLWPINVGNSSASSGEFLIEPKEVEFNNNNNGNPIMILHPNRPIITVGIHSRIFSRDQDSSAYTTNVSMLAMLFSVLVPAIVAYLRISQL